MVLAPTLELQTAAIQDAHWRRDTSFGVVYEGVVQHAGDRSNSFVETVPNNLLYPDSAVVIGGGFTSSEQHYTVVQRQLGLLGERSVFVGHDKHRQYEIGHNAEDIAATCEALALGGVRTIVLLGHSRGGPEVLEAHEIIRERGIDVQVSDIVLAFPAQFIEGFPLELAKSMPKFVIEMALGFIRHPARQIMFNMHAANNIMTDAERTIKEGLYLLLHHSGSDMVHKLHVQDVRPHVHFIVGLLDGLVSGNAVVKSLQDGEHDSLTVLRSGHIDLNTAPEVTQIIHSRVRRAAKLR